jgi:hypothetical protein
MSLLKKGDFVITPEGKVGAVYSIIPTRGKEDLVFVKFPEDGFVSYPYRPGDLEVVDD